MNREELDRELEEWLDRAGGEFGRAEIRPGFESRVIANVSSRLEKRKRYFHWVPVAAAAVLILSVLVVRTGFQDRPIAENRAANSAQRKELSTHASRNPVELKARPAHILRKESARSAAVPSANKSAAHLRSNKPGGRFLATGLSEQERCLIAFARSMSQGQGGGNSDGAAVEGLQPDVEFPEFKFPDFEITSFSIEESKPKTRSEEKS